MNRTKIICTSGPSIDSYPNLLAMVKNGMSILRLNCSHGNYDQYEKVIGFVRKIEKEVGHPVSLMIDLQGPKLRIGDLPIPFKLERDQVWHFSMKEPSNAEKRIIQTPIKKFSQCVPPKGHIFLDDGLIEVEIISIKKDLVSVKIVHGGILNSRKGMNIPFYKGRGLAITPKDKRDLKWGLRQGVDLVALSFVRSAKDILELKKLIATDRGRKSDPLVFAKIEKPEAVDELDAIIDVSDGILVARGDLGIELRQEKVPVVQKQIIEMCRLYKKPNIVATQMLDSMRHNPIPTRAEVSDVANAIYSGTDAVLLTGETSSGQYPIEACATLNRIITEVESHLIKKTFYKESKHFGLKGFAEDFLFNAMQMATAVDAKVIVMLTKQGNLIKVMSKFHPKQPIYCLAPTVALARKLNIYWGVIPISIMHARIEQRIEAGIKILKKDKAVSSGERVIFVYRDHHSNDLNLKVLEI